MICRLRLVSPAWPHRGSSSVSGRPFADGKSSTHPQRPRRRLLCTVAPWFSASLPAFIKSARRSRSRPSSLRASLNRLRNHVMGKLDFAPFGLPCASPTLRLTKAKEFRGQFFPASLAPLKTDHCGRISSKRLAGAQAVSASRLLIPVAPRFATIAACRVARYDDNRWGFGWPGRPRRADSPPVSAELNDLFLTRRVPPLGSAGRGLRRKAAPKMT